MALSSWLLALALDVARGSWLLLVASTLAIALALGSELLIVLIALCYCSLLSALALALSS